jgi:hypothetical protein
MRECVCFVYILRKGERRPIGTAFLFSTGPLGLMVTALHVIANAKEESDDGNVYLRVNTEDGFGFVQTKIDDWMKPDQSEMAIDVAVCFWPFPRKYRIKHPNLEQCATEEVIEREAIDVGLDVFFPGLFVMHHGRERNVPIVRVGAIASMPEEPVSSKLGLMDAYLIETRSVGGLSGSPVFVQMGTHGPDAQLNLVPRNNRPLWYLLGVMHGHWDAELEDVAVDDGLATEYVNMGIAIVTPISKLIEFTEQGEIAKRIETLTKKREEAQLPTMDAAQAPEGDEAFERFEGLAGKLPEVPKEELDEKLKEEKEG